MENLSSLNELEQPTLKWNKIKKIITYSFLVIILFIFSYFFLLKAPSDFPISKIVQIEQGTGLRSISLQLKQEHIISSRTAFEAFVIIYGGERHLIPADYLFEDKESVWEVARRIFRGDRHLAPVKVTIPEGFNISDIANTFILKLAKFNKEKFLLLAKAKEGYLFPDTYFFFTNDTEVEVFRSMSENFEKKITPLIPKIISSGKNEKDIIVMASIIEGEAKGDADRGVIAGILWKRISIGMPLQVDSAPETYEIKGLPNSPIGNPGLLAIESAISPQSSPYFYYLHDKNGLIHYAKTFTEHKANIKKYLK
ncbi:MAG: endolytic transglycosylase MltG [Candidatus Paceibacterota bacterium]